MEVDEIPTERKFREPDRILVNDTFYDRIALVSAHHKIPKYLVYGYALEYATRNFSEFRNYVDAAEKVRD